MAERSPVLSEQRQHTYVVRQGDTLYSIAWRFELDHLGLARANGVKAPYMIYPGQNLRLVTQLPPAQRVRDAGRAATRPSASPSSSRSAKPAPPAPPQPAARTQAQLRWVWPLDSKPTIEFGRGSKGLDFGLARPAADAMAAAAGEVVYAGTGIGGYERLVIIKHNAALLSAYSFDGQLKVREQQQVKAGGVIGNIRRRGPTQHALHFELRQHGKPVNPRNYLR